MSTRFSGRSIGRVAAELVVVFIGVALALGAENWREERAAQEDVQQSLRLMMNDLESDSEDFRTLAESLETKTVLTAWIVENRDRNDVPADSIADVLHTVFGQQTRITTRSAGWRAIDAAGSASLIEPDTLQTAVLRYYENRMPQLEYWQSAIDDVTVDHIFPSLHQYVRYPGGAEPGTLWPPESTSMPLVSSWREFQDDLRLQNYIVGMGRLVDFTAEYLAASATQASELRAMILAEMGPA